MNEEIEPIKSSINLVKFGLAKEWFRIQETINVNAPYEQVQVLKINIKWSFTAVDTYWSISDQSIANKTPALLPNKDF